MQDVPKPVLKLHSSIATARLHQSSGVVQSMMLRVRALHSAQKGGAYLIRILQSGTRSRMVGGVTLELRMVRFANVRRGA